ncbi:MAG: FecCD family ABC transporter permease [Pleomorphochaeta sp.]
MKKHFSLLTWLAFFIMPIFVGFCALTFGRYPISINEAYSILFSNKIIDEQAYLVIYNIRLPRIILALCVGAGLSVSGVAFQSLFSNPLATPDTLGVASGASFGAVLAIVLGFSLFSMQVLAFIFGIGAVVLTFFVGSKKGELDKTSIILSGIIIGALFNAFISLIKYTADAETELPAISYWLMGSLSNANFKTLKFGLIPILLGLIVLYLLKWRLNLLSLSQDEANSTGVNINILRIVSVIFATIITSSAVSMCGQVGWIGLLVPHICRMIWGSNNSKIIPASISLGATFMVIIDTFARTISASEIPISVLTAIIGAPFFIMLLKKSNGWSI